MTARDNNLISFHLSGEEIDYLRNMAKTAGNSTLSKFAKGIVLDVIADDRAAHEGVKQAVE